MEQVAHWTHGSTANFVYSISSNFVAQLENRMEETHVTKTELAGRLKKTTGRVSQVFNDPGNLSLRVTVDYAVALGMKVGVIAYDDGDPTNDRGPINPDVFVKSWEKLGKPSNLFEVEESKLVVDTCSFRSHWTNEFDLRVPIYDLPLANPTWNVIMNVSTESHHYVPAWLVDQQKPLGVISSDLNLPATSQVASDSRITLLEKAS